jgi:tetratricopeptide (TPR) repeat protein
MQTSPPSRAPEDISDELMRSRIEPALQSGVPLRIVAQFVGAVAGFTSLRAATNGLQNNDAEYASLANPIVSINLKDGSHLLSGDAINWPLFEAPDSFGALLADNLRERGAAVPDARALVARKAAEIGSAEFWTTPDLPSAAPHAREAFDRVRSWLPILAAGDPQIGPAVVALTARSLLARFPQLPVDEVAALGRIVLETAIVVSKIDPTSSWEPEPERRSRIASQHLEARRPELALAELEPLLTLSPADSTMLAVVARAALAAGDRERAIALALDSSRLDADDRASPLLDQIRASTGPTDWVAAARARSRATPSDWRAHAVVIEADLDANDVHDDTMDHVATMFRLAPEQPRVQILAGRVAAARHRPAEARTRFLEALRLNPDDHRAQDLLADLDARRFRYSTAANLIADRQAAEAPDAVAHRLADGLVTRVLAGPVLGPMAVAFLFWHQMRPRRTAPADWSSRTIAGDLPWLIVAPLLVVVISVVQGVLLHRATQGRI